MKMQFECNGRYEAEKLAALVSVQKDDTVYVEGISTVIGTEIVIKLKDKSSHAVVMKDGENVSRLKALLQDVIAGRAKITGSDFSGSVAEISIEG
ncbi:MAG: hypothetical protein ABI347_00410 [Nitrososphaera sp.]|jgi:hypothetical protein